MEKILITGTGRCGTTFLIKLFSFLGFDTGYNRNNYKDNIFSNSNSGMERWYTENYYILKNPYFISNINTILNDQTIKIKLVIIPVRDYTLSAKSRARLQVGEGIISGGLWCASDEQSQLAFYKNIITNYIYCMTKYDICTLFLDFDKMTTDNIYLFNKLKNVLDEKNINFETFSNVYNEVTLTSRPK